MAADLQEVKGMWEMAATLDFLNLFRWGWSGLFRPASCCSHAQGPRPPHRQWQHAAPWFCFVPASARELPTTFAGSNSA